MHWCRRPTPQSSRVHREKGVRQPPPPRKPPFTVRSAWSLPAPPFRAATAHRQRQQPHQAGLCGQQEWHNAPPHPIGYSTHGRSGRCRHSRTPPHEGRHAHKLRGGCADGGHPRLAQGGAEKNSKPPADRPPPTVNDRRDCLGGQRETETGEQWRYVVAGNPSPQVAAGAWPLAADAATCKAGVDGQQPIVKQRQGDPRGEARASG